MLHWHNLAWAGVEPAHHTRGVALNRLATEQELVEEEGVEPSNP